MNIRGQDDYQFGPNFQPPERRCSIFYWYVKISGNHCTISWQLFFSLHIQPDIRAVGRSLLNYYRHANEEVVLVLLPGRRR